VCVCVHTHTHTHIIYVPRVVASTYWSVYQVINVISFLVGIIFVKSIDYIL